MKVAVIDKSTPFEAEVTPEQAVSFVRSHAILATWNESTDDGVNGQPLWAVFRGGARLIYVPLRVDWAFSGRIQRLCDAIVELELRQLGISTKQHEILEAMAAMVVTETKP